MLLKADSQGNKIKILLPSLKERKRYIDIEDATSI